MAVHTTTHAPDRAGHAGHAGHDTVCPNRASLLAAAVELQVDEEDVQLRSPAERELWEALQEEFQAFVARFGPVWIADG